MSNIKRAERLALVYDVLLQGINVCPPEILTPTLKEFLEPHFKTKLLYKVKNSEASSHLDMLLNQGIELTQLVKENSELKMNPAIQLLERFLSEQMVFIQSAHRSSAPSNHPASQRRNAKTYANSKLDGMFL
ncbi:MAG: hypothetical protein ACYCVD_05365 [Desulfitobacteriaceae bacterium]